MEMTSEDKKFLGKLAKKNCRLPDGDPNNLFFRDNKTT